MAAADDASSTIGWTRLREAVRRAGSFEALLPYLLDGRIRARHGGVFHWPNGRVEVQPWFDPNIPLSWWASVSAAEPEISRCRFAYTWVSFGGVTTQKERFAIDITLEPVAVERWFPAEPSQPEPKHGELHGAAVWIVPELARMKKANKIPPGITISELSQDLADRMIKAAAKDKSIRPIKRRSIENVLRECGLFPIK